METEEDLWTVEDLAKWRVQSNLNPFLLADDHAAVVLRFTTRAVMFNKVSIKNKQQIFCKALLEIKYHTTQ